MKFQLVILSLLITGAAGATLASGLFMPTSEEPVAKPVPPQPPPQPRLVGETTDAYFGVVKAVGADWLELEAGWEGARTFTAEGKEIVKKRDNTKVKRISVAGTTVGGNPNGIGIPRTYRITDLKVGDVVLVSTGHTLTGEEWGTEMRIKRRPGGKIPPVPGEVVPPRPAGLTERVVIEGTHVRYQAEQDWEEKGVPIPKRFLDRNGRAPWTNPPYPPVAPLPRERK